MRISIRGRNYAFLLTMCVTLIGLGHSTEAHAYAGDRNYSHREKGATETVVVTSLGDSIAAGFCGVGCLGMPSYVDYYAYKNDRSIASTGHVNIDGRGRAVSGYTSKEILKWIDHYDENTGTLDPLDVAKDVSEADVITIDACGNDYLPARRDFKKTCDEGKLIQAVEGCKVNLQAIYARVLQLAKPGVRVRVMNLLYPGYFNEDSQEQCHGRLQSDIFLEHLVENNYYTCEYARKLGIPCADAFSIMNTADENRSKLAWIPGGSLESYKERITVTYRDLITDPRNKKTDHGVVNFMQSDNIHPTAEAHSRLGIAHYELGDAPTK